METYRNPDLRESRSLQVKPAKEFWILLAAMLFVAFYFATSINIASHRLLWDDEIGTVMFARLPGVATIWKVASQVDPWGMPAPYYIVVHGFQRLFGPTEVGVRLPSALAMVGGLLIVFDCTRRLADGLHGLMAVALLTCSRLPYFGFEARSYSIYFMLAALSLWVWTHTSNTRRSAVIFCAIFFCSFMMHPYAAVCLLPYALWDLCLWRPWRLPSAKVIAGVLGIGCAAALLSVNIAEAMTGSRHFPGPRPSLSAVLDALPEIFPAGLFLLALVMVWIALVGTIGKMSKPTLVLPMQPAERVGWFFLLMPMAGFLMAEFVTNAFSPRYFIGMLPGVAVAFACLFWRYFRESRLVAAGVFSLLTLVGAAHQLNVLRHAESFDWPYAQQTETRQMLGLEDALRKDGKQFILISSNMLYREGQYYSKHPEGYRFMEPADEIYRMPEYFAKYYSLKTWSMKDLKEHARETAVIRPPSTILTAMKEAGFVANTRFTGLIEVVYFQ
jgi:mannosyltransferase